MAPQRSVRADTSTITDLRVVTYHYRSPQSRTPPHNGSLTHIHLARDGDAGLNHTAEGALQLFQNELISCYNIRPSCRILPPAGNLLIGSRATTIQHYLQSDT